MSRRNSSKTIAIANRASQLALAVPKVMAHRLTRMALAGPAPTASDREEFKRMGEEKVAAIGESLNAMAWKTMLAQQRAAMSFALAFWNPSARPSTRLPGHVGQAALDILGAGMAPFHRRATANARRLGSVALRRSRR